MMKSYRSIRFNHPDFDDKTGFDLAPDGKIALTTESQSIRQAILMLLSTRPGERIMRPTYGCAIHQLVFNVNDPTTAGLAIHYIRTAIERWEPRVEIIRLEAEPSSLQRELLNIYLQYRILPRQEFDQLSLAFELFGGFS